MKNKMFLLPVFMIFIISIFYFCRPLYSKLNPLQSELDNIMGKYTVMSENFETEKYIIAERREYLGRINELNFNNELSQGNIIAIINDCTAKNNILISNIKFSVAEDILSDVEIEIIDSDLGGSDNFQFINVKVEFKLEFEELLSFIDDMRDYGNDISVTGIHVISWEGDMIYAVVDMKFYAVPMVVET